LENNQYISIVSNCAASGSLVFTIETQDLASDLSITLNVSGLIGTETSTSLASKIYTQLNTTFVQQEINFDGSVFFPDNALEARFDANRTEHVINIFSQCNYSISVVNTTGADIVIADHPVPLTIEELDRFCTATKKVLSSSCGDDLSDEGKVDLLTLASAGLCAYLNNNIALTTYLYSEVCKGTKSIFTNKKPLRDFWAPTVRRPYGMAFILQSAPSLDPDNKVNYAIDSNREEIYYRFAQDMFESYEPFDDGNEVLLPYIAGYPKFPTVIKQCLLQFIGFIDYDPTTKSYKAEGFEHVMNSPSDIYASMDQILGIYRIFV
jgi:hypothetical protein